MPVRWNQQHEIMIGDAMSNQSSHFVYTSPLDKFKNEHFQLVNSESENLNSSKLSNSCLPKPRNPNIFRHWAEPPPPPIRTRKVVEKKPPGPIKRRPGSADPRFRRHLDDKSNLITQSDPKIKKNILLNDASTLGPTETSQNPTHCPNAQKPVHCTNIQIHHVNEWLQTQLSTGGSPNEKNSNIPQNILANKSVAERHAFLMNKKSSTHSNHSNDPKQSLSSKKSKKCLQENSKEKIDVDKKESVNLDQKPSGDQKNTNLDPLDGADYQETLKLMPNDLVHKYPDFNKQSHFGSCGSEASLISELTDQILISGSAPCLDATMSKVSMLKSKGRLEQVVDYYENDKKRVSPLIETNDSQLNLMCANPEANGLFYKTLPYSLWYPNRHFCLFMIAGVLFSLIGAIISAVIPLQEYINLLHKRYFEEPEESFIEKYIFSGLSIDLPKNILTKILEKILAVLVLPVDARH